MRIAEFTGSPLGIRARGAGVTALVVACLMLTSNVLASPGSRLWVKRYDGPASSVDAANALGVSPDGSTVFVTGESNGSTSAVDYATVAYDAATGAKKWAKRYNGPANSNDWARALALSPDGSAVFVTGDSWAANSYPDYATVAYDASTGAKLWSRRYNGPENGDDYARALGVSPDGSMVFVTGSTKKPVGLYDYATVAYDAATGARLWTKRDSAGIDANALGVSPDGSMEFVTRATFDISDRV